MLSFDIVIALILYAICAFVIIAVMIIRHKHWYEWDRRTERWEPYPGKPDRISYSHTKMIRGRTVRIFRGQDDRFFVALDSSQDVKPI